MAQRIQRSKNYRNARLADLVAGEVSWQGVWEVRVAEQLADFSRDVQLELAGGIGALLDDCRAAIKDRYDVLEVATR